MLWQWVGRSVTLFGALPPNRTQTMTLTHSGASELAQLMEGTTAGALIPEIVRRGFHRADSRCQLGFSLGCRIAIARSAVMSCITACRPSRIESNPVRRSRFRAAVRNVARTPAPFPR